MPPRSYLRPPGNEPVTRAADRRLGPIGPEDPIRRPVDQPPTPRERVNGRGRILGAVMVALLFGLISAGLAWWAANLF